MKFATFALVGTAAACGHHKCTAEGHHHSKKHHGHHGLDVKDAFLNLFHAPKKCHLQTGDEMSTLHELRLLAQTGIKSWAQGYYQENGDVVSDECFGDWMHAKVENIKAFHKTWKSDPMAVELDDYYTIAKDIVDLIFKNKDTCSMKKQTDDFKLWCSDNEDVCLLGQNVEQRIMENAADIIGTLIDIFHIIEKDDTCYTSQEQLAEYSRLVKDAGELTAAVTGFDLKWDQTNDSRHIKRSAFRSAVKGFYHRKHMTLKEIMEFDFPELSVVLEDFLKAIHELLHKIHSEIKDAEHFALEQATELHKEVKALFPAMPNKHNNKKERAHKRVVDRQNRRHAKRSFHHLFNGNTFNLF